jgi:hypothetical protein
MPVSSRVHVWRHRHDRRTWQAWQRHDAGNCCQRTTWRIWHVDDYATESHRLLIARWRRSERHICKTCPISRNCSRMNGSEGHNQSESWLCLHEGLQSIYRPTACPPRLFEYIYSVRLGSRLCACDTMQTRDWRVETTETRLQAVLKNLKMLYRNVGKTCVCRNCQTELSSSCWLQPELI